LRERRHRRRERDARVLANDEQVLPELVDGLARASSESLQHLRFVERPSGGSEEREHLARGPLRALRDGAAERAFGVGLDARQRGLGERDLEEEGVAGGSLGEIVGQRASALLFEGANEAHRILVREREDLVGGRAKCRL
jgi:hypothetical protein